MNKQFNQIKESIVQILKTHKEGLDITQISKKVNLYRATVSKYLSILEYQGIISSRKIGPSKVYFLVEDEVHHIHSPHFEESKDWIDEFIEELKEELKKEILGK